MHPCALHESIAGVGHTWLLITVSTPSGGTSTLRVFAWRTLRGLGAHYLQQSVCLLPATTSTTRATTRLAARIRSDGGQADVMRISITDSGQEAAVIDAMQRERADEYQELIDSAQQFRDELARERHRGRTTYTEWEESDVDLARHKKWLTSVSARDYFDAPNAAEAAASVESCEDALAQFESEALSAELDNPRPNNPADVQRIADPEE